MYVAHSASPLPPPLQKGFFKSVNLLFFSLESRPLNVWREPVSGNRGWRGIFFFTSSRGSVTLNKLTFCNESRFRIYISSTRHRKLHLMTKNFSQDSEFQYAVLHGFSIFSQYAGCSKVKFLRFWPGKINSKLGLLRSHVSRRVNRPPALSLLHAMPLNTFEISHL